MTINSRWTAKRADRVGLLARANASVKYWARRAGSRHGRQMLEEAKARRALRQHQIDEADRVLARHRDGVTTVSPAGVAFVAGFEGFSSRPYWDPYGKVWTIGYGETGGITAHTAPWTRAYALQRLRIRLNRDYLAPVLGACQRYGVVLTQHEADALASLSYNCGPGVTLAGHSMGTALASGNRQRMADAFLIYVKAANGQTLQGLVNRRRAERAMFLRP